MENDLNCWYWSDLSDEQSEEFETFSIVFTNKDTGWIEEEASPCRNNRRTPRFHALQRKVSTSTSTVPIPETLGPVAFDGSKNKAQKLF